MKMILLALAASAIATTVSAQSRWRSETLPNPMGDAPITRAVLRSDDLFPTSTGGNYVDAPLTIVIANTDGVLAVSLDRPENASSTMQCNMQSKVRVRFDSEPAVEWPCVARQTRWASTALGNQTEFAQRALNARRILIEGETHRRVPVIMSFTTGR